MNDATYITSIIVVGIMTLACIIAGTLTTSASAQQTLFTMASLFGGGIVGSIFPRQKSPAG
jgi:hypothetical protein